MSSTIPQVPTDIAQYIEQFEEPIKSQLLEMRSIILEVAPDAKEVISYAMPAIRTKKVVVWYAGYKNHIGFYPSSSGIAAFTNEISKYKSSKGAVQFPIDKVLPKKLIQKIVVYRLLEVLK